MSETTSYHPLSPRDQTGFEELYALYRSALPEHEQKSHSQLLMMLRTPDYLFLSARRAQRLVGFAVVYTCQSAALTLLEYLAVTEDARGSGLGASLFALCREHAGDRTLLVEMDVPRVAEPSTMRRSDFYRRRGCRRVEGLEYILPLPDKTPPPMWLLTLAARHELPRVELADWLHTLYREVYSAEQTDPRIARMLAPLPESLRLIALPGLA
jgi:N-acetylglutamate synthase-like GNAT family acetyltransferase